MKWQNLLLFWAFSNAINANAQLEITTGYAVNRNLADGLPLHIGYEFKMNNKFYIKSQVGYKYLYHFNDFVGASIKVNIYELHQTASIEIIKKERFILKPNIGLNYRFYFWKGEMKPPYNSLPQRVWKIEFRDDRLRLNSFAPTVPTDGNYTDTYRVSNFGFTFQLQCQFKIKQRLWIHVTPFIEPDYDGTQNTGGCYIGIIFKKL